MLHICIIWNSLFQSVATLYLFRLRDNVTLALMLMLMPLGLCFTPFAGQPIIRIDKDTGIKFISKFMSIYVAKCETWPKSSESRSIKIQNLTQLKFGPFHIQGHLLRHVHTTSSVAAIFRSLLVSPILATYTEQCPISSPTSKLHGEQTSTSLSNWLRSHVEDRLQCSELQPIRLKRERARWVVLLKH